MVRTFRNEDRKLEMLLTAGLIQRCAERCPEDEIYKRGIRCYEVLLDVIEKPEVTGKIAEFTKRSEETIKNTALKIVNQLLFNKGNDPFLSLGLPDDAEDSEIKKRWKRLLMFYHPDRAYNRTGYEEISKKINQVYEEVIELKEKNSHKGEAIEELRKPVPVRTGLPHKYTRAVQFKYLKHLPAFILFTIICIAIVTIVIFVIYMVD
jgi:hypothetical protein